MLHRPLNPRRGIERLSCWSVVAALAIVGTTGSQVSAKSAAPGQSRDDARDLAALMEFAQQVGDRLGTDDFDLQQMYIVEESPDRITATVILAGQAYDMELQRQSLRGADFKLLLQGVDGELVELQAPQPQTYRGRLLDAPDSIVAASYRDGALRAMIRHSTGETWFVEPLSNMLPDAPPSAHVAFLGFTRQRDHSHSSGDGHSQEHPHIAESLGDHRSDDHVSTTQDQRITRIRKIQTGHENTGSALAELAIEVDFLLYRRINLCESDGDCTVEGSTCEPCDGCDNANDKLCTQGHEYVLPAVENLLNLLDALWRDHVGVGFQLVTLVMQTAGPNLYDADLCFDEPCQLSDCGACDVDEDCPGRFDDCRSPICNDVGVLCEMRRQWNANYSDPSSEQYVHRDIAHLLTGTGSMPCAGISYGGGDQGAGLGAVCTGHQGSDACDDAASNNRREYAVTGNTGDIQGAAVQDWLSTMSHEIAHNFSSEHCSNTKGQGYECELMCPGHTIDGPCDTIIDYRNSLTCLDHVIYVDKNATGNNHGRSWTDAYSDLQDALSDAAADPGTLYEIWVVAGTYTPAASGSGDRVASFTLFDGVALYGGFDGTEGSRDQRDAATNTTVLSGDIDDDDAGGGSNSENSYHVVVASLADESAVLDGFLITGGNANGGGTNENRGGGLFMNFGSPTLRDCLIAGNRADSHGGGLAARNSSAPTLMDCQFVENEAGSAGGGMWSHNDCHATLIRCVFTDNQAGSGGGMTNVEDCHPDVVNCRFAGNTSTANGGGGAGMYNWQGSSPELVNCVFTGNQALSIGGSGGAIRNHTGHPTLINCTLAHNVAGNDGGGIYNITSSNPVIENSILWGNRDNGGSGSGETAQIYNWDKGSNPVVEYTCVEGWTGGGTGNIPDNPKFIGRQTSQWTANAAYDASTFQTTFTDSNAEWDADSLTGVFLDADNSQNTHAVIVSNAESTVTVWGDFASQGTAGTSYDLINYRFQTNSPALDVADNSNLPTDDYDLDQDGDTSEQIPIDVQGRDRIIDDTVDMGAYEGPAGFVAILNPGFDDGLQNWMVTSQSEPGEPEPVVVVEDVPPMPEALHVSREPSLTPSSALVAQGLGVEITAIEQVTLSLDVWVVFQNFDEYNVDNVYPANVWVEYEDEFGGVNTFRRSFYISVAPGHTPDPFPLAEEVPAGIWQHRDYDLSNIDPPIVEILEVRVGAEGWSYDVAFDNVQMIVHSPGLDCNGNGIIDEVEIAAGSAADCNGNVIPDECDLAVGSSADCDGNGVPDECDADGDLDGVPNACDNCANVINPDQTDSDAPFFLDDFESAAFDNWSFADSTDGQQAGDNAPGEWSSTIVENVMFSPYSARLYAHSDVSQSPWAVIAAIDTTVASASELACLIQFEQIQGSGAVGVSFFQITVLNALDENKHYSYTFCSTGDVGPDSQIQVDPGVGLGFAANFADDYADKYNGEELTGPVRVRLRSYADYAEGSGGGPRTTEVLIDDVQIYGGLPDGVGDECDNCPADYNPEQTDCDGDGVGDLCAIASGISEDEDGNGIPDECEACGDCPTDSNGNGDTEAFDLAILLGAWGAVTPDSACLDADENGYIEAFDLAVLLGAWGPCYSECRVLGTE